MASTLAYFPNTSYEETKKVLYHRHLVIRLVDRKPFCDLAQL